MIPAAVPYLSCEVEDGPRTQAQKNGFHPDDRRFPVDDVEWLKANDLPTGWAKTEDSQSEPDPDVPEELVLSGGEVLRELAPSAASVLMKIVYAARMARFDLLRPAQRAQDAELRRLVRYINSTKHWKTCLL